MSRRWRSAATSHHVRRSQRSTPSVATVVMLLSCPGFRARARLPTPVRATAVPWSMRSRAPSQPRSIGPRAYDLGAAADRLGSGGRRGGRTDVPRHPGRPCGPAPARRSVLPIPFRFGLRSVGVATVLVVDDDGHIREVVRSASRRPATACSRRPTAARPLAICRDQPVDVVVLDIVMPEQDGLEVCRRLRERSRMPILFLSSRDDELDRVLGLEIGADDYVTKPFSPRELVARVKALLRRAAPPAPDEAQEPLAPAAASRSIRSAASASGARRRSS